MSTYRVSVTFEADSSDAAYEAIDESISEGIDSGYGQLRERSVMVKKLMTEEDFKEMNEEFAKSELLGDDVNPPRRKTVEGILESLVKSVDELTKAVKKK